MATSIFSTIPLLFCAVIISSSIAFRLDRLASLRLPVKESIAIPLPSPSCPAGQVQEQTSYLHYPQQTYSTAFCNSVAADAQNECGYHCKKVCRDNHGASATVASVTLNACVPSSSVPGFSSGILVKMDVCCSPPPPPSCPSGQVPEQTSYLHYPQQTHSIAFCNSVAADAQNECGFHCKKVCRDNHGASATVASVTLNACVPGNSVPGFSSGTLVKMDVCCSPPPPPSCPSGQVPEQTPYLHYPQQTHSTAFCNSVAADAQNECGFHCKKVCRDNHGASAAVASVTLNACVPSNSVPGFPTGTLVKMDVCCLPPTCPAGQVQEQTPYLHYPQQTHSTAFCNSVAADAQNECGFHCKKVCRDNHGASATVASVTLNACVPSNSVPGFSTGTLVKMDVCCNP
ncbi:uncharacterized protein LOC106176840 [Lingula anatina]|uniref:Uncharacterized protein LOC106176840 n=1 Tax=Lingula anatina TaxID=7574 RepID=A0A1S3JWS3_LINAN|nr:uncharacterized protein LOC106176840 [Lingula anatina]|eukprot:XP_013414880.1 uncharacterized protein LOC106176840 [Lingula anatina]